MDNEEYLRRICKKRAQKLGLYDKKEYKDRFEYELKILKDKDFIDYILIVADIVHAAHEKGIFVGPSRGSAGGSLICYLTQITQIDPIKYDLLFERFVSPSRVDLPDIDLDFASSRRYEMIKYVSKKYGKGCVARIPTSSTFGAKQALKDVSRVYDIDYKTSENLTSQIDVGESLEEFFERSSDAKKFQKTHSDIVDIAKKIEGSIRHRSIHAGGIIVSPKVISESGYGISLEKIKGQMASCFDKNEVEPLGFLKMDLLAVDVYDVIQKALELIHINHPDVDLPTEFEDKQVYELFQKGLTTGIFQFNTPLLTNLSKQLQIDSFDLLTNANALVRPGPLRSGETDHYVKRHIGKEKIKVIDERMKEITEKTNGLLVYQEQLMQVVNKVGGMSLDKAEKIRKLVSKSKGADALDVYMDEFIEGCGNKKVGEQIWNVIRSSGSYLFNKSHSCAYAIVAYWDAYLKTYYPREFLAAMIQFAKNDNAKNQAIRELRDLGYGVKGPDINESKEHINISEDIRMGLADVANLGDKSQKEIIKNRPYASFDDFLQKVEKRKVNSRVVKNLIMAGAFDKFDERSKLYYSIATDEEPKEWSEEETIRRQMAILDLPSEKPLIDYYENPLEKKIDITPLSEIDFTSSNDEIWVRGIASDVKVRKSTPKVKNVLMEAQEMAFFSIDDGTKSIPSFVPPEQYMFYNELVEDGEPLVMKCHTYKKEKLYVDGIINLNKYCEDDPIVDYALFGSGNKNMISTISYHVSKKGNAFARINFGDRQMGLLFQLPDQYLRVGQELDWEFNGKEPFIKVNVR